MGNNRIQVDTNMIHVGNDGIQVDTNRIQVDTNRIQVGINIQVDTGGGCGGDEGPGSPCWTLDSFTS